MNYETAKQIVNEAGMIVDAAKAGQAHIDVRKALDGPHFSIMLPNMKLPPAIEYRAAVPEQPATDDRPAIPAQPEIQAVSSQELLAQYEREAIVEALKQADLHLPSAS